MDSLGEVSVARVWRAIMIWALRALPRHGLSRLAGWFAGLRWPGPLQRWQIRVFGRAVGVDFSEVRRPLTEFRSLQEFFTRELREGARPLDASDSCLVAPCDGAWGASGEIRSGTLFQLKGRPYSLADLLNDDDTPSGFEGGSFATFYLAPRDYHRFHSPCALRVTRARYVPGSLWPVNSIGLNAIDGLFAQNERLCIFAGAGGGELALVAVGATLVGKVRVRFDELTTHARAPRPVEHSYGGAGAFFAKGEELGRFEFGSTLVLLLPPGLARLEPGEPGAELRLGQPIARLCAALPGEPEPR